MKQSNVLCLFTTTLLAGLAGGGCMAEESAEPGDLEEDLSTTASAVLTKGDTDVPAECQGILTYVNTASLQALDAFLPSNVAQGIVSRRATRPFFDLIDLSSVSGVAQARLSQIAEASRAAGKIGPACVGVYEELGVSADDRTAILAYINTVTAGELEQIVRYQAENTVPALLAARPFTSLQTLADVTGVSLETFRSIRDAAIDSPFDLLADSVNTLRSDSDLVTAFDVFDTLLDQPGRPRSLTCFGIDPQLVASFGGTMRPNLATASEVVAEVTDEVNWANRYGQIQGVAAGLADLNTLVAGQSFSGCYQTFEPDPWSGVNRSFFINVRTGYRILTETRWSE
jgi:DNA uptake protein ComE-like DNA-binding protein